MEYLSDNQIIDEIKNYIQTKTYNHAIMIDGEWGSGKTYFLKNILKKSIENIPLPIKHKRITELNIEYLIKEKFFKATYISLFGIENLKTITNQIYLNVSEEICRRNRFIYFIKKISIKMKPITDGLLSFISKTKFFPTKLNINKIIGQMAHMNEFIYIFDDLERANMPITTVLGYINNLVEQNNIKVIIAAYEKELYESKLDNNIELKYLVALNEKLKVERNPNKKYDYSEKNEEKFFTPELNLNQLKDKTKNIFYQHKDYKRIKEKIIGKTLLYRADLKECLPNIINNINSEEIIQEMLHAYIGQTITIMDEEKHYNLRTFQHAVYIFNELGFNIFTLFDSDYSTKEYKEALVKIMQVIYEDLLRVSIHFKKGKEKYNQWDNNTDKDYGDIFLEYKVAWSALLGKNSHTSFRYIHDIVYDCVYDYKYIFSVTRKFILEQLVEIKLKSDPAVKLNEYWQMEDEDVMKAYKDMINNLKSNKYDIGNYIFVLEKAYIIKQLKIPDVDIEEIINIMHENIDKCNDLTELIIELDRTRNRIENDQIRDKFIKNREKLLKKVNARKITMLDETKLVDKEEIDYSTYFKDNKKKIIKLNTVLTLIDINDLIRFMKECKVTQYNDLRYSLESIYDEVSIDENLYDKEINSLYKLIDGMRKAKDELGYVKKYSIDYVIKSLDKEKRTLVMLLENYNQRKKEVNR